MNGELTVNWKAGWYATRLHAVPENVVFPKDGLSAVKSVCGAWVYDEPRTEWAKKRVQHGVQRCKHCTRRIEG